MEIVIRPDRTIKVYSKEEKLQLIAESKTCGTTLKKFCEARGISRFTVNNWKQMLKREEAKKQSVFIPIATPMVTPERIKAASGIPLRIGQYQILVPDDFQSSTMKRLLNLLEARNVH